MSAPDRIWLGRDTRYVGNPWIRLASEFDDEDKEICEYVRADIAADLLAAMEACAGFSDCNGMVNGVNVSASIARAKGGAA